MSHIQGDAAAAICLGPCVSLWNFSRVPRIFLLGLNPALAGLKIRNADGVKEVTCVRLCFRKWNMGLFFQGEPPTALKGGVSMLIRVLGALAICTLALAEGAPNFGGKKEVLTINTDQYEVSVQKNGRVDLRTPGGAHIFDDIVPLARVAGEEKDRVLRTRWQESARSMISDALGEGQGFVFAGDDFEWHLRTYPSKPYLAVRLAFRNSGKEPVEVARLVPWSAGSAAAGGLSLGPGTGDALILDNGHLFRGFDDYAGVSRGSAYGNWNIAAFNPQSGRSLIAGFLTNLRCFTEFEIRKSTDPKTEFSSFRAECVYDPPISLAPGESLSSEWLYLGVAEENPLLGLERFAKGEALWNKKKRDTTLIPHGWDSWSTKYHHDIDEASMLAELAAQDAKLKRYGWTHFAIDAGWERLRGDWQPDPVKFPNGMKPIADEAHRRGMTASLWLDPFTVNRDAPTAKEHPEWMTPPAGAGLAIVGNDNLILDVTAPGAEDYVRGLAARVTKEWGFDGIVEADFVYHEMLAEHYAAQNVTKVEVLRRGMLALREGAGADKFIMGVTPQPINGSIVDGIRVGRDCAPLWRAPSRMGNWAAVETLVSAARKWYLGAHLYVADQDCAFFGHASSRKRWNTEDNPPLTWDQSVAWLTGAALTGGAVKIGEPFSELEDKEVEVLRRLLPAPPRPAQPIDVFREGEPRIWHLPLRTDAGAWDIVGLFNWDETGESLVSLPFDALGIDPRAFYTVYDFWPQQYLGTATGQLDVKVPASSVRLLGLRRLEETPMLIACDRHYTQGALDHTAVVWDAAARTLTGHFTAVAQTPYVITVSVPMGYTPKGASWSGGEATLASADTAATVRFNAETPGPATWQVQF